jgi:transcriptional regulator with XRE-family HTH domain
MSGGVNLAQFEAFGRLLGGLRTRAGIARQTELASRLGITQQTVSRWERGLSRPRDKDIPRIASVLAADQSALFEAAGYARGATAATFDHPFPVNALSSESFERFCAHFLERLYRDKRGCVHRAGGSGHRQDGIDISVTGDFGRHTFQCKRVEEFGPQKVRAAIAKHNTPATEKFLLLSNIASPQSRAVLADHPDWQIWDREDISRRVRSLPQADQRELVDTFFRGKRLELLGEPEAGPWMTTAQYFGPYLESGRLFNHTWQLVGRSNEAAALRTAVGDDSVFVAMLVGPAGGGKTRLLRHVVEDLSGAGTGRRIWFLSPTEEVTATHLEQLGHGQKLLVIDDAHDRDDLSTLFRYCALPDNQARLLLALRPYGRDSVKYHAASLSLSGPNVRDIDMPRPTRLDAEALASEVLLKCNGPMHMARDIASATFDSPLATVVGAQIVARQSIHPALLANAEDFQTQILAHVQDVIAGEIVTGLDVHRMQGVLRIVSLVQPVLPDEPALLSFLKEIERIDQPDAVRLLRTLTEAGVLFRRGLRYRLSPDLLADSIISRYCINEDGTSNGYIERLFDIAQPPYVKNLLINLGRLDWRLRNGHVEDSRLLEGVWRTLRWQEGYFNPHVDAATAVAYYQPRMAINFARRLIEEGHGGDVRVGDMLKNAAYNVECLDDACELLWRASRDDQRSLPQHPHHGIRILKELATFEPNKPSEHMAKVVAFAFALVDAPAALTKAHTPFVILEAALAAEGHSTVAASRRSITLSGYATDRQVIGPLRERVISTLLTYIEQGPPRKAFLAAKALAEALRRPMGILGARVSIEIDQEWQDEHERTLERLGQLLTRIHLHPVVLVRVAESVAWHAFHDSEHRNRAQWILSLLDRDLETRLVRALMDPWGTHTWPLDDPASERESYQNDRSKLQADLAETFDDSSDLCVFMERCLLEVSEVAGPDRGAPEVVVNFLIEAIPDLAKELLRHRRSGQEAPLNAYTGMALSVSLANDSEPSRGALRDLAGSSSEGLRLVAEAYARFEPTVGYTDADVSLLRAIFSSKDPVVLDYASRAARQVARSDRSLAVSLSCSVDLVAAGRASHHLFMWLSHGDTIPRALIGGEHWQLLLNNLESVQELDDYWVREFLKNALQVVPDLVIDLFKNRLLRVAGTTDWSFSPLHKSYKEGDSLGLLKLADSARHLKTLLDWALERADDSATLYRFGNVVAGLCGEYDQGFLDLLVAWMAGGNDRHTQVVAAVLREAQNDVIFDYHHFVRDVISAAQAIGPEAAERVSSSLFAATSSGVRSTSPGEPFPEDVRLEKHASEVLSTLSRWDPVFELFTQLLRSAKTSIAWQRREKEAMDAEEEQ